MLKMLYLRPTQSCSLWRIVAVRSASSTAARVPEKAKFQLKPLTNEVGFFSYDRYWSRDDRFVAQSPGDTPRRFLFRRLGHAFEIYPILFLEVLLVVLIVYFVYYSFMKMEVFLDKSKGQVHPGDWARIREDYWKYPTLLGDFTGVSHQRNLLLEKLQDELLAAAKKRGTR